MMDRGWTTIVCCASGPSMDAEQGQAIMAARASGRCRVIAVNDTWRLVPEADVMFAYDKTWLTVHVDAVRKGFAGELWTISEDAARKFLLNHVKSEQGDRISAKPDTIQMGSNTGFGAMMLATLFGGARRGMRIVLVGYDMQWAPDGKRHWFGDHPSPLSKGGEPKHWLKHFDTVAFYLRAKGIEVTNATKETALQCFPRATLEEALA